VEQVRLRIDDEAMELSPSPQEALAMIEGRSVKVLARS
jgi:hypothetical protein